MDVFKDLYQQLIIDHNQNPRNFKTLGNANHSANGYNPLCGDEISVSFIEKNGLIEEIASMNLKWGWRGSNSPKANYEFAAFTRLLHPLMNRFVKRPFGELKDYIEIIVTS